MAEAHGWVLERHVHHPGGTAYQERAIDRDPSRRAALNRFGFWHASRFGGGAVAARLDYDRPGDPPLDYDQLQATLTWVGSPVGIFGIGRQARRRGRPGDARFRVTNPKDARGNAAGPDGAPPETAELAEVLAAYESLAAGPAELPLRIDLLRRLRALEWRTSRWTEELAVGEQVLVAVLFDELRGIAARGSAITTADVTRAEEVAAALSAPVWLEPLQGDDIQVVQRTLGDVRRARTLATLDGALAQLDAARYRGEWEQARDMVAELEPLWRDPAIRADDERWQIFDCIRRWVDDQFAVRVAAKARAAASEALREACDSRLPWSPAGLLRRRSHIDSAARQLLLGAAHPPRGASAASDGSEASVELADAAALARVGRRRIDRRLALLGGTAACCGVLLVVALSEIIVTVQRRHGRSRVVAATREAVLERAKAGGLHGASDIWKQATAEHHWLALHPVAEEIRAALADLERSIDVEQAAVERSLRRVDERLKGDCRAALATLRAACSAVPPSRKAIEAARAACGREVAEAAAAVESAASRLAAIEARDGEAVTEAMRSDLDAARQQTAGFIREMELVIDRAAADTAQRLRDRLNRIGQLVESGAANAADELRQARGQFAHVEAFGQPVPREIDQALVRHEATLRSTAARAALRHKLDVAAEGGSGQLLVAVKGLAAAHGAEFHAELGRVAETAPAVEAAEVWARVARAWQSDLAVTAADAATWARALGLALEAASQPVLEPEESERLQRLQALLTERAAEAVAKRLEPLAAYLATRIMQPQVICVTDGDRRIYTEPDADAARFIDEETLAGRGAIPATPAVTAAHVPFARRLREIMADMNRGRIDPDAGLAALLDACGDEQLVGDTDKLLLCRLQRGILVTAIQGVLFRPAAESLEGAEFRIRAQVGRLPPWVDPQQWNSVDAWRAATKAATKVTLEPREIEAILRRYREERERLGQRPAACQPLVFVGWVDTSPPSPQVRLTQQRAAGGGGRLYVVQRGDGSGWRLSGIGTLTVDGVGLQPALQFDFGQPVYLVPR